MSSRLADKFMVLQTTRKELAMIPLFPRKYRDSDGRPLLIDSQYLSYLGLSVDTTEVYVTSSTCKKSFDQSKTGLENHVISNNGTNSRYAC